MFSFALIIIGLLGVGYGFVDAHKYGTVEDVKTMLANEASHGHGGHGEAAAHDTHADKGHAKADAHGTVAHADDAHHGDEHAEHVMHQIHNRPYAALYVAAFFFFMIALGALAFYGIQWAAQAGWSPVVFRIMEAITYYVLPGGIIVLLIAFAADSHLFV